MEWNDVFYYDESSPSCLRWKISNGKTLKDSVAGTIKGQYYYRVQYKRKIYTVHRIIWEMFNSEIQDTFEIDHKDLNKENNKIGNLRLVSKIVNCRNRPLRKDSTSGINNVYRRVKILKSGNIFVSWIGRFLDINGKRHSKEFSVRKYGEVDAKQMAIEFTKSFEKLINNYTTIHGEKNEPTHNH